MLAWSVAFIFITVCSDFTRTNGQELREADYYSTQVLASAHVPDDALRRACYTLRFLLADHSEVRSAFYRLSGRVAVLGKDEGTTYIPEHSHLAPWWNFRARGLGATPRAPVSSGGEENLLCYRYDWYREQDIFLHEASHGVHLLGAAVGIPGWDQRLRALFNQSKARGLWANTYSMTSPEEYFAEGTQSYFNVNSYVPRPDGVRGPVDTRDKLRAYDPGLYSLIREVFPCDNVYLRRCYSNRTIEDRQHMQMDCDLGSGGASCSDQHVHCAEWAAIGQCSQYSAYMTRHCRESCELC
ncbi:uncharacterized protein LOC131947102 isoform X2 [Physella acuta]|uniref:uncharacterized protein LOC131947102 isoform X2 n=1 Tax=Physella acuta TaxID=109671 RepID=UPI0027DD527E|nr:uncharacterized protein LOC131947102 isoform X2 [Physella acuta]